MRNRILFCMALLSALATAEVAELNAQVTDSELSTAILPKITISPFPIMSWVPPSLSQEQMSWFSEAGFNVMHIYPNEGSYAKMKKNWNGNWMLFKEWNEEGYDYKSMCDFHADDPKRIGFMLGDEPNTQGIGAYAEQYDYLRQRHPDDICLVNLFPSYVSESHLGSTFLRYLETYYETLRPRYASLDHYPCFRFNYDSPSFYHDLELNRDMSLKYNCNLFGFVQVYSSQKDRDISASDLAWQVNSFLAYGCKGLWYFYFRHPLPGINELSGKAVRFSKKYEKALNFSKGRREEEYNAPIYFFGSGVLNVEDQKGERFDDVSEVNKETLVWGDTLLGLTHQGIRHSRGFNEGVPPVGTAEFMGGADKYVADIQAMQSEDSMGYILSYFEDEESRPYLMVVNKRHGELMDRRAGSLSTVITFTPEIKQVYLVSNQTGEEEKVQLSPSNALTQEMLGGGALLMRLDAR